MKINVNDYLYNYYINDFDSISKMQYIKQA